MRKIEAKSTGSEGWRTLTNFEAYEISIQGQIRAKERSFITDGNLHTRKSKTIKPYNHFNNNSLRIHLTKDGKRYSRSVAYMMIESFYEIKQGFRYEVSYRDGDLNNCSLDNLIIYESKI
ncbi:hypothetical protein ACOCEA_10065 [Maribacter sp. CXY002]|uniref:hypothetical protein n=1 Tax=Maribacter luteocoastalis TaxID=3407671 RepID=UPI003B682552